MKLATSFSLIGAALLAVCSTVACGSNEDDPGSSSGGTSSSGGSSSSSGGSSSSSGGSSSSSGGSSSGGSSSGGSSSGGAACSLSNYPAGCYVLEVSKSGDAENPACEDDESGTSEPLRITSMEEFLINQFEDDTDCTRAPDATCRVAYTCNFQQEETHVVEFDDDVQVTWTRTVAGVDGSDPCSIIVNVVPTDLSCE